MDKSQEGSRRFFVSRGHSPKSFDVVEEAFDEVAEAVEFLVMSSFLLPALARRNHWLYFARSKFFDYPVGIVSPVGQARGSNNIVDEVLGDR